MDRMNGMDCWMFMKSQYINYSEDAPFVLFFLSWFTCVYLLADVICYLMSVFDNKVTIDNPNGLVFLRVVYANDK